MSVVIKDISLIGGDIIGIVATPDGPHDPTSTPILVFVHGGGATARTFDIPGHSQLQRIAANGFTGYALHRPGYGASPALDISADTDSGVFEAHAKLLNTAIAELWDLHRENAPGVVIVGCSIGGAISMHMAAQWAAQENPAFPLLGLAFADVAQEPHQQVIDAWQSTPVTERIDMVSIITQLAPPPLWTLAAYQFGLHSIPGILEPVLRNEGLEIVTGWLRDWHNIASSITVPVHYRLGDFDSLWMARQDLIDEFAAALRTQSPYVDAALFPGGAHGIADSVAGREYCWQVIGFAERCASAAATPQLLGR